MYKTFNNLVPVYITELIPPLTGDVSNNPLRNSNNIAIPFTRTEISHMSCIPSSITLWNSLDQNVRTIDSLKCFKNHIKVRVTYWLLCDVTCDVVLPTTASFDVDVAPFAFETRLFRVYET